MNAEQAYVIVAARAYVAARTRLAGADNGGLLDALHLVDDTWCVLHRACGVSCADVCPEPVS